MSAELVEGSQTKGEGDPLTQKAIASLDALFGGVVSYYVETVSSNGKLRLLVFISEFTKGSRPLAWKKTDLKIQSTLPLLGNDETSLKGLANGLPTSLVKVTLALKGRQVS